jgi:phospholipid/cholesterol/gamma-HCH transport system substrate-binding protein
VKEQGKNFVIGIVTLIALAGVSTLLLQFGELDSLLHPTYPVEIRLNEAGTTRVGSPVTLNGVRVGTVTSVELVEDAINPVVTKASIEQIYNLPIGTTITVNDALIGSGGRLNLTLPANWQPGAENFPQDGSAVLFGTWRSMTETITLALDGQMTPLMSALDSFNGLAGEWTRVGSNVNEMLDPDNKEDPGSVIGAIERFDLALVDAQDAMILARTWLGDEQLRADVNSAVWKANELMESAGMVTKQFGELAETIGKDADTLVAAAVPVAEEMSRTLERVGTLLQAATKGEGTIGQLMSNPDLYRSLEDAAKRLENTLQSLEILLQKIKDEGLQLGM